jgi:Putative DNA-binding domain
MPTLNDAQRILWQLIAAPEGVGATLAGDADRGGTLRAALSRTVRGDARLDAVARLDIYANMYFFRVLDVLKEHYAATYALLGDVAFHNLITDYLLRHPPTHFSIREAGRHLPELLAAHEVRATHPCAADLARFERALNDAFDAADAPAMTAAALAGVAAGAWPSLRLELHPTVRLLDCGWPVHVVRAGVERGEPPADPQPERAWLCVWRQDLVVFHRPLEQVEFVALRAVQRGASFAAVCATADELLPDGEAPQRVAAALAGWLSNGWLADREARPGGTV